MKKIYLIFFVTAIILILVGSAVAIIINDKELHDGRKLELVKQNGKELWFVVERKLADGTYKLKNGKNLMITKGIIDDNHKPVLKKSGKEGIIKQNKPVIKNLKKGMDNVMM